MNRHIRLAALFVILALAGCAQGLAGQAQTPHAPYSPQDGGNMNERGSDM